MTDNSANKKENVEDKNISKVTVAGLIVPLLIAIGLVGFTVHQSFSNNDLHQAHKMTMDTSVELRFSSGNKSEEQLEEAVFAEIERLEQLFSRGYEASDVSKVNAAAGLNPVEVSPEALYVIEQAVEFAELTEGSFDPTIAPLVDLWGFLGQEY
ncbi:MAG: FAD:protein FMN transferase, partial [Bacillota bacterium]